MQAVYRVYFWSNKRGRCDSFELTGAADVDDVLDWINANASGREVEAMAVIDRCAAFLIGRSTTTAETQAGSDPRHT